MYTKFRLTNIDVNKICYLDKIETKKDSSTPLRYNNNSHFLIELPAFFCLTDYKEDTEDILFNINGINSSITNKSYQTFKNMDEKFKKKADKEECKYMSMLNTMKTSNILYDVSQENRPYISLTLLRSDDYRTKLFDKNKKEIPYDEINNYIKCGRYFKSIIEIKYLLNRKGKMKPIIRLHQLKIVNIPQSKKELDKIEECLFSESYDGDKIEDFIIDDDD